jgi:ADP-ribosyl-[dinitrogen reductase] hydrolase
MAYARRPAEAIRRCADSSATTHGAPTAVDACRYFGGLLVGALNGAGKEELLSCRFCPTPRAWEADPLAPEVDRVAGGSFKARQPPAIRGTGFVVDTLEAALWAFLHTDAFRDGCLMVANLGDDADTTGAVYGQLAGAYYGENGIPPAWRARLALREEIETFAERLLELAQGPAEPIGDSWHDPG